LGQEEVIVIALDVDAEKEVKCAHVLDSKLIA
jgi:hypothetical protein